MGDGDEGEFRQLNAFLLIISATVAESWERPPSFEADFGLKSANSCHDASSEEE